MIISMPFLLATHIVYALLPDKNLHGNAMMCYAITLFGAYLILVSIQLHTSYLSDAACKTFGRYELIKTVSVKKWRIYCCPFRYIMPFLFHGFLFLDKCHVNRYLVDLQVRLVYGYHTALIKIIINFQWLKRIFWYKKRNREKAFVVVQWICFWNAIIADYNSFNHNDGRIVRRVVLSWYWWWTMLVLWL